MRALLFCLHEAFKIKMIVCFSYTSDSFNTYKISGSLLDVVRR